MGNDQKIDEILSLVQNERALNNSRFVQLSTGMHEIRGEMRAMKVEIKEQINKVYTTLSEDIQAFGTDLEKVKRRVDKIERKIA